MSIEESNIPSHQEIQQAVKEKAHALENVVKFPDQGTEHEKLVGRVGVAAVGLALKEPVQTNISPVEVDELEKQVVVELENENIKRENENIRNELTGKLAADIMRETIMPAAEATPAAAGGDTQPPSDTEKMRNIMEAKFGATNTSSTPTEEKVESALNNPSAKVPEAKQEIPKHEVGTIDSQDQWKHDIFDRLGARFARMGIQIKSGPKRAVLETIRRLHAEGAAKIQVELATQKKEVDRIEAQLAKREEDAKVSTEKMSSGGFFDRLAAAKLEREKQDMLGKLEKAKIKYGQTETKLDFKNKKSANYQDKLTQQATTITAKVDQILAGDKASYETLTVKQEELAQKLVALKQTMETAQNDLLQLEVRLKNKPEAAEKAEIKNGIIEAKKKITELLASYKNLANEKSRVQTMTSRAQLYLSGWDGIRSPAK